VSTLPVVSGREVVKAVEKIGYVFDRQRGSHMILRQQDPPHRRLTIPDHKEAAKGTLRGIIRQAGLTVEEFSDLLWINLANKALGLSDIGQQRDPKAPVLFTSKIGPTDAEAFDDIRGCAVYLQQYLPKLFEVRVTIFGHRIFAVAIDSQSHAHTTIDWRRAGPEDPVLTPHDLPVPLANRVARSPLPGTRPPKNRA